MSIKWIDENCFIKEMVEINKLIRKLSILVLLLFFLTGKSHAMDKITYIKDPLYRWTIKYNMPITGFGERAVTVMDNYNNFIPVRLERSVSGNELYVTPLTAYEYGKKYTLTVHGLKTFSGSNILKNSATKVFYMDFYDSIKYADDIVNGTVEGENPGEYAYGAKDDFKNKIDSILSRSVGINEQELNLLSKELEDAIRSFHLSINIGDLGQVIAGREPDEAEQNQSSIKFKFEFLASDETRIQNELIGFKANVIRSGEVISNQFIDKSRRNSIVEKYDDKSAYVYEGIDLSLAFTNINRGDYLVRIKPVFKNVPDDLVPYNDYSGIMIKGSVPDPVWEAYTQDPSSVPTTPTNNDARFLPWFNLIEVPKDENIFRYEIEFSIDGEKKYFTYDKGGVDDNTSRNFFEDKTHLSRLLLKNYSRNEFSLLDLGKRPEILVNVLEKAKSERKTIYYDILGYNANGGLISRLTGPKILDFKTSTLPRILNVKNLTTEQNNDVFAPFKTAVNTNEPYEVLPISRGEFLTVEMNKDAEIVPYRIDENYIVRDSGNSIRSDKIRAKMHETRYQAFPPFTHSGMLADFNRNFANIMKEEKVTNTKNKTYNGYTSSINTDNLEGGLYMLLMVERDTGLYYPLENLIVNIPKKDSSTETGFGITRVEYDEHNCAAFVNTTSSLQSEYGTSTARAYVVSRLDFIEFLRYKDSYAGREEDFFKNRYGVLNEPYEEIINYRTTMTSNIKLKQKLTSGYYYLVMFYGYGGDYDYKDFEVMEKVYAKSFIDSINYGETSNQQTVTANSTLNRTYSTGTARAYVVDNATFERFLSMKSSLQCKEESFFKGIEVLNYTYEENINSKASMTSNIRIKKSLDNGTYHLIIFYGDYGDYDYESFEVEKTYSDKTRIVDVKYVFEPSQPLILANSVTSKDYKNETARGYVVSEEDFNKFLYNKNKYVNREEDFFKTMVTILNRPYEEKINSRINFASWMSTAGDMPTIQLPLGKYYLFMFYGNDGDYDYKDFEINKDSIPAHVSSSTKLECVEYNNDNRVFANSVITYYYIYNNNLDKDTVRGYVVDEANFNNFQSQKNTLVGKEEDYFKKEKINNRKIIESTINVEKLGNGEYQYKSFDAENHSYHNKGTIVSANYVSYGYGIDSVVEYLLVESVFNKNYGEATARAYVVSEENFNKFLIEEHKYPNKEYYFKNIDSINHSEYPIPIETIGHTIKNRPYEEKISSKISLSSGISLYGDYYLSGSSITRDGNYYVIMFYGNEDYDYMPFEIGGDYYDETKIVDIYDTKVDN